jgi:hypothetical protein
VTHEANSQQEKDKRDQFSPGIDTLKQTWHARVVGAKYGAF